MASGASDLRTVANCSSYSSSCSSGKFQVLKVISVKVVVLLWMIFLSFHIVPNGDSSYPCSDMDSGKSGQISEVGEPSFTLDPSLEGGFEDVQDLDAFLDANITNEQQAFMEEISKEPWFDEDYKVPDNDTVTKVADEIMDEESSRFLPLDASIMHDVYHGGRDRSAKATNWARGKFDEWRRFAKMDTSIPIEDLPYPALNEMLVRFLIQTKKNNGQSLNNLFKTIGRIVRKKQEMIMEETGVEVPKFNIVTNPMFSRAQKAFIGAADRARRAGVGTRKRKAPEITFRLETELLADPEHQVTDVHGLQKRLCYYVVTRFGIRGYKELHATMDCDFSLGSDSYGEFVAYHERVSKNWGCTVTKFDSEHFRPPVWTHEEDFVFTYKRYLLHLPPKEGSEPRSFFLQPITRPSKVVWYQKGPVGTNKIRSWLNVMGSLLNDSTISNKSGRVTTVSRLSLAGVPPEIGCLVTGHKRIESYQKYDRTKELQVNACMSILACPFDSDGNVRTYKQVLNEEIAKKRSVCNPKPSTIDVQPIVPVCDSVQVDNLCNVVVKKARLDDTICEKDSAIMQEQASSDLMQVDSDQVVSTSKGKELINSTSTDGVHNVHFDPEIDNDFWDEVERQYPQINGLKIVDSTINNTGGQSFMGATNNNCSFYNYNLPDPTVLAGMFAEVMKHAMQKCNVDGQSSS